MVVIKRYILLLLLAISFSSCIEYDDVEFLGVENYSFDKVSTDIINIRIDMKVMNPNTYNIKIKKSAFDIFVNDKALGKAHMTDDIKLTKKSTEVHSVVFKTSLKDLSKSLMGSLGVLFGGKVKVKFKGRVKAKAFGVGKKFDVDFEEAMSMKDFKF